MIRPGSNLSFNAAFQERLQRQWESDRVEPFLRALIVITGMIFHEQESSRITILKLLGNTKEELELKEGAHYYGCAADVSVRELVDVRYREPSDLLKTGFPKAAYVARRINELVPFGDGSKKSAVYNKDHIHLEVPMGGFKKSSFALCNWQEVGACGLPKIFRQDRS